MIRYGVGGVMNGGGASKEPQLHWKETCGTESEQQRQ